MAQYIMFSEEQQNGLVAMMHAYKSMKERADKQLASDIGYFDPTMRCDTQHPRIYHTAWGFGHRLKQCRKHYNDIKILTLLPKCLRGSALTWFNKQAYDSVSDLFEIIIAMVHAFPAGCSIFDKFTSYTRQTFSDSTL